MSEYSDLILQTVGASDFLRATFSGPPRLDKSTKIQRAAVRLIDLHGQRHLQVSQFTQKQDHTKNLPQPDVGAALADLLSIGFANVHLTTATEEIDLRLSKKLELHIGRRKRSDSTPSAPESHNRPKNLPLPEGKSDHILQLIGIMTDDGRIRPTMRAKYTQINEFLKLLDHVLPDIPPSKCPLQILDCGSGSAYLTIAVHHYLNDIKKIPATLLGVDLNEDLIQKSARLAQSVSPKAIDFSVPPPSLCATVASAVPANNLQFLNARIGQLENVHPDIVLALHACDTATDDAIAQAIKSNARLLLVAPCCHKNLNKTLHAEILAPIHQHGILHQRLADLATDALRAQILRIMGYRTEVIEFISAEHTAKNLLIRAVKIPNTPSPGLLQEYIALKQFFGVTPYLEQALGGQFPAST